jgi:hypothetical protein
MKFWVALSYVDSEGVYHPLGSGTFTAASAADAEECAMQAWWDPRLETTGCSPVCKVERFEMKKELKHFEVIMEFEATSRVHLSRLRAIIEAALRHSTASEAIRDAVGDQFDEADVEFCGWFIKED